MKCSQCKNEVEETFAVKITDIYDDEYEVKMCDNCIKNLLDNVRDDTEIYRKSSERYTLFRVALVHTEVNLLNG